MLQVSAVHISMCVLLLLLCRIYFLIKDVQETTGCLCAYMKLKNRCQSSILLLRV